MCRSPRSGAKKSSKPARPAPRNKKLALESLEPRAMLSASSGAASVFAQPNLTFLAGSGSSFNVYSPAQIRAAYGFNQLSLNGAGQTIAIVDAYNDPTIKADLAKFDSQFGIAAPPKFTVAEQYN